MRDTKIKMTPSCWPRRAGSANVLFDRERSMWKSDLRSGSDHDPLGQYAHSLKRVDEPSRLTSFARLYPHPVATYWRKTYCDLIWPQVTPWPPIVSCNRICTDEVRGHDAERIGWFRSVYAKLETFLFFPHRVILGRSRNWGDLGHKDKNCVACIL